MDSFIKKIANQLLINRHRLDTIYPKAQNKIKDLRDFNLIVDIIIEGHTDSIDFNCPKLSAINNNWQLSATRAKTIYDAFKSVALNNKFYKIYEKDISIRGYADTRPFRSKINLAENRRIEITFNAYLELIKSNNQPDSLVFSESI